MAHLMLQELIDSS